MISLDEYRERRARLLTQVKERHGPDTVVLLQGGPQPSSHTRFRQVNDFAYLCQVETPHAYLLLDSHDDASHLFLPQRPPARHDRDEPLVEASDPEGAAAATGVDAVHGFEALAGMLVTRRKIATPMRPGEGAMQSWDTLRHARLAAIEDPWDGRPDRMAWFLKLLRERFPTAETVDLAPLLDEMRLVKSEAEIDLLRRSGALGAHALNEAMRATRPGCFEHQIDALLRYVYLDHGARDVAYRAIVAGGQRAWYGHYTANDARLEDGELLLVDCGPDFGYYASDVTRMWPVNGVYDDAQRQLYGFMVAYHQAFLRLLRPGVTAEQVRDEAAAEMAQVLRRSRFDRPNHAAAAERTLVFPYHLSHPVGLAVHDVGHYRGSVLRPGIVLTVDPQLLIPEERCYVRVEDTVVITEDGIENLTGRAPLELDEVEALMRDGSFSDGLTRLWSTPHGRQADA